MMRMSMQQVGRGLAALALWLGVWLCGGCAGYQLGTSLPAGVRTVYVPMFENGTDQARIEFDTTNATILEFAKDGTLKVVDQKISDTILIVRVTKYELLPVRYESNRLTTTAEYRLVLTAEMTFKTIKSGKISVKRTGITGETVFAVAGDLSVASRNALPKAAQDLGYRLVRAVVEYW